MCTKRLGSYLLVGLLSVAGLGAAERDTRVIDAVKSGNTATLRALLQKRADVNTPEADGATALHWAVNRDNTEMVQLLIAAGANVKAANRYGITPLLLACETGSAPTVEALLKAGADPNGALPEGETALMTAARAGKADVIKALVAHGGNVNAQESWHSQTALMWAASENHPDAIKMLTELSADVNLRSDGGFTPIMFAARAGKIEAVEALLKAGANANDTLKPKPTAQATAAPYNNGVNANATANAGGGSRRSDGPDGTSALVLAITNAHYELAKYLVEHGADPNLAGQGWTALHQLAYTRRPNHGKGLPPPESIDNLDSLELAKVLLEHGANPNLRQTKEVSDGQRNNLNRLGSTPLLLAAKHADAPFMRLLAANGADPKITTDEHASVLMAAAGVGLFNMGESAGTNEEALEAVKVAYEIGSSDINTADDNGWTALHGAALRGSNEIVQFLAEKGTQFEIKSKREGWTPLRIADGVHYTGTVKRADHTAELIRKLMVERGLTPEEKSANDVAEVEQPVRQR